MAMLIGQLSRDDLASRADSVSNGTDRDCVEWKIDDEMSVPATQQKEVATTQSDSDLSSDEQHVLVQPVNLNGSNSSDTNDSRIIYDATSILPSGNADERFAWSGDGATSSSLIDRELSDSGSVIQEYGPYRDPNARGYF
jgi:hypothetical protein